jgi:hypothetical protein
MNNEHFEQKYQQWMGQHRARRGEAKRRLVEGHGHLEKLFLINVWWPAFADFKHLHPEYEVFDFKDGTRYLDFAYILPGFKVSIELDGFGPHARDVNRNKHSDNLDRQNYLVIDEWKVIRFSHDHVNDKPRHCQQMIQQLFGKYLSSSNDQDTNEERSFHEKEVVRIAVREGGNVRPKDIIVSLEIGRRRADSLIESLVMKGWLLPESSKVRIRRYRLAPGKKLWF